MEDTDSLQSNACHEISVSPDSPESTPWRTPCWQSKACEKESISFRQNILLASRSSSSRLQSKAFEKECIKLNFFSYSSMENRC